MKIINKIITGTLFAIAAQGFTSCNSFLEEYSQDLAKVEGWEDLDEVLLGSAYLHIGRYYNDGKYNIGLDRDDHFDILHFMGDEIIMTKKGNDMMGGYYTEMFPFFTWQQDTGTDNQFRYQGGDEIYFNSPYKRINVCNMVISVIDDQPENKEGDNIQKRRVKGEAYFLRALYYFFLANMYCEPYSPATAETTVGLPLKFSEIIEDKEFDRQSLAETYKKVLEDLAQAEECLKDTPRKSEYRADVNAVRLLQSRVYLYMQDWDNAVAKAKEVIDANSALMNIGTKGIGDTCLDVTSPEMIFSMGDYLIAYLFQDTRSRYVSALISDDMVKLYSADDYRKERYLGKSSTRNVDNVFRKVNGQTESVGTYTTAGSVFCFRTAEAYLTLAEASCYNGDETTAKEYLERFLKTRMMSSVTVTESGNDLIDLIRDERAREFLLEGHRWFDLRRYSVCQPYPWSKEIVHGYIYIDDYEYDKTDWYRLEKNDKAYTLPIPRSIRNFQVSLGNVDRPARMAFTTTNVHGTSLDNLEEDNGDDDDDWDW